MVIHNSYPSSMLPFLVQVNYLDGDIGFYLAKDSAQAFTYNYVAKAQQRKGGYNHLLRNMVIEASLMKSKFYDSFLWQKQ